MNALSSEESRREDLSLITRIIERPGDGDACERLVNKYWRLVLAWVRPRVQDVSETEDVVQEAFMRAFQSIHRLEDHQRFVPWLLRIALNRATDLNRKRRKHQSLDLLLAVGGPPGEVFTSREDLAADLDRQEQMRLVVRALDQLPDKYRMVVFLRYFEGLSGNEISTVLGEPEGTVRNRLFRAHQKIRRLVGCPGEEGLSPGDGRGMK